MAIPAEKSRVLLGGLNLSVYSDQWQIAGTTNMLETTCFANSDNSDQKARVFIVGGDTSTLTLSGPLDVDATASGQFDTLADWKGAAALPVTVAPSGLAALSECFMVGALESSLSQTSSIDGRVGWSANAQTDGRTDPGTVLENLTAVTIDGNGTARDLTASSSNGGVAHLHVTAFSGLTSDVVTIEDSADGSSSWATILTFTTVAGVTSERVAISGTVRRYLRVVDNVTGTGSITRSVTFARR